MGQPHLYSSNNRSESFIKHKNKRHQERTVMQYEKNKNSQ